MVETEDKFAIMTCQKCQKPTDKPTWIWPFLVCDECADTLQPDRLPQGRIITDFQEGVSDARIISC